MPREQTLTKIIYLLCICVLSLLYFVLTTRYCAELDSRAYQESDEKAIIKPTSNNNNNKGTIKDNKLGNSEEYEEFINQYIKYHHRVTSDVSSALQAKYLIVDPPNYGWGNRFNTLITSLLVAILTDRIWLIKPKNYAFNWYFDLPMNASWVGVRALLNSTEEGQQIVSDYAYLNESYDTAKLFLAGNLKLSLQKQIVFYSGMDYQVPLLQRNPNYKRQIRHLFPGGVIYHRIFHSFMKPKLSWMQKVANFSSTNFRQYTLGIQARTKKVHLVDSQFCDIAKAVLQKRGADPEFTTVFIATDGREKIWTMIKECLWQYNVTYLPDSPGRTASGDPGSDMGGIIDLYLLARCNDMIITHSSSYGATAAAIANVIPYSNTVPSTCGNTSMQPVIFYQPLSSEPCMYYCKRIVRDFGEPYVSLLKADGMWIQFCQCHYK